MLSRCKTYCLLIFLGCYMSCFGQESTKEMIERANKLFEEKSFVEAEPLMSKLLSTEKDSKTEYNFKYGVCTLYKYADKTKSLTYLERASKDSRVDPRVFFYLGKANHLNYLFADALVFYKKYKTLVGEKEAKKLMVDMHITMCESGQNLMKNLSDLIVEEKISTAADKFQYSYDLSKIGGRILITDQFQSKLDQKKGYKAIIYFPPIGQDQLFFSSYGKDGENGLDIYTVNRLSTGEWSEPKPLPENINTPYDDNYPYLHPDGKTLYFSSKGHNSMGGYDIFRTSYDAGSKNYGPVDNLDYKINSTDDEKLYIVDDNNVNAFFSSNRASDGNNIDVYKVRVKVFPIQKTIIAGTFANSMNSEDLLATIKVQDVRTDKLIGIYTVDDAQNYTIILPNAGKYKFIVETPLSEKIHAGLVDVKPQKGLKALKQEIELINNNGAEKLIIRNLFDVTHENETKILASVVKQMANPEVNIDEIPDSILTNNEPEIVEEVDTSSNNIEDLLSQNNENIHSAEDDLNELNELKDKTAKVAQLNIIKSEEKAKEADNLLAELPMETNDSIKNEKIRLAAKLNAESKQLNDEAQQSIKVVKRLDDNISKKEESINELKDLNAKIESAANNETADLGDIERELKTIKKEENTPLEEIQKEAKAKEKEANNYLNEAQTLRTDQESMQYQLDQEKNNLSKTKKKKDINSINENIALLEKRIDESESLINEQFSLYESAELDRKELVEEAEQMENIQLSDDYDSLPEVPPVDIAELEEKTSFVEANYIEKNDNQLDVIAVDLPVAVIEDENNDVSEEVNPVDEQTIVEENTAEDEIVVEEIVAPEEMEHYNEVSESLEETTTNTDDFDDVTETVISYDNPNAQSQVEELESDKEEMLALQAEINELENELSQSTKPKKIEEIQSDIDSKNRLLNNKEDEIVKSYEEINEKEIAHNKNAFTSSTSDLSEDAKADEDFLSATFYMESANKQLEKADKAREQANNPTTPPAKKKELLKEAYKYEMVAIDDQQTANNLMEDVQEKHPVTEKVDPPIAEEEEIATEVTEEIANNQTIEKEKEEEFIEQLPSNIPVLQEPSPVEVQNFQGESFDPASEPDNYTVAAVADPEPVVKPASISNKENKALIESNQKNIDKVTDLQSQQEVLELQKNDVLDDKLKAKIDKRINKLEKKKAKSQLKMADDVEQANQSEINLLSEEVTSSELEAVTVEDNYKKKQADNYNSAAQDLKNEAIQYRDAADKEKDPVVKADLIEKAIASENTSITYLKKSKKLYSEAIVEDFSDDKLTIAKSVQQDQEPQSEKLEEVATVAEDQAINLQKKAQKIREDADGMSKKDKKKALVEAEQYDQLANNQKRKADDYREKAEKYKEIEMAVVEDISLAKSMEDADVSYVAGTEEFKSYNNNQEKLNELDLNKQKLDQEKDGYDKIAAQMEARSAALKQEAKSEKNPIKKADLINESNQFDKKAKENKQMADALVIGIDSINDAIKGKEVDQEIILSGLDSTTARQVRALAISGKSDELIEQIAQELPPNEVTATTNEAVEIESIPESANEIEAIPEVANEIVSPAVSVITSKNFVPPPKIVKDIFVETKEAVYSEDNPIPVNPKMPEGLIYKVQVGAFRKPIPQDLFKGFAPISAEKVRDDITRYRVGYFTSYAIANESRDKIRQLGYRDAFVVAIMNGNKITIAKAKELQSDQPPIIANNNPAKVEDVAVEINKDPTLAKATSSTDVNGVFYSVQVGAFSKPLTADNTLNVTPLVVSRVNNLFKYSTGIYKSIEDAGAKKADLLDNGVPDAFIIAYSNGKAIPLDQATSTNPDRVVAYKNPDIYYIDMGTYQDSVPKSMTEALLSLKNMNIRSRPRFNGKQYYSKKYNTLADAESALENSKTNGLKDAKIIKAKKDNFNFNYEFRIDLGTYSEALPDEISTAFNNLKNLDIKPYEKGGQTIYYTISRDNYDAASTDLNACRSQDIRAAKIVVFKGGVETSLDNVLKSFK